MKKKILFIILMNIVILNMLDGIFTTYWIEVEDVKEANPLMEVLVEYSVIFMIIKISLVSLGVYLLWLLREKRFKTIFVSSSLILIIFSGIFVYHLYGIFYIREIKISEKCQDAIELQHYYNRKCWIQPRNFSLTNK